MEKSEEFGTLKNGFFGLFQEADETSQMHHDIGTHIIVGVEQAILDWKNEHFKRALAIMNWKESKLASENFEKAQKQWAKLKLKVEKYKKHYHISMQICEKQKKLLEEARRDPNFTEEEKSKQEQKFTKCTADSDEARKKYEQGIEMITKEQPEYIRNMTTEFERCQNNEKERIEYFKKMMQMYHNIVNISRLGSFGQGYAKLQNAVQAVDAEADLQAFSKSKGVDMEMEWPHFEEYGGGIVEDESKYQQESSGSHAAPVYSQQKQLSDSLPEENEWSDDEDAAEPEDRMSSPMDGPKFVALYDYQGRDHLELTLREGDVVIQTQPVDQDGWCTGILNGKEGLYPANYVQPC
eukprot:Sdes_comp18715_c0_seq1m9034